LALFDNSNLRGFQKCVVCWCVMVVVQSLGVPWQLTKEYCARAFGMRIRSTGVGTREGSFSGLKSAKNLDNAEIFQKQNKEIAFSGTSRANPGMKPTSINS